MASNLRSKTTRRLPFPLPAVAFVVAALLSFLLTRTSSSTLYAPLTSQLHAPPPQPTSTPILNSIIVPAYHERANLRPLAERVFRAVREPKETELIIVDDDSRDGTAEEVVRLREEGYRVELLVRTDENGLSSAVLRGFEVARGSRLVVMDADLQVRTGRARVDGGRQTELTT
jgi:dolichol-phosphate mannosyltransferase